MDRGEINAMAKLVALMNQGVDLGGDAPGEAPVYSPNQFGALADPNNVRLLPEIDMTPPPPPPPVVPRTPGTDLEAKTSAMKSILESFKGAVDGNAAPSLPAVRQGDGSFGAMKAILARFDQGIAEQYAEADLPTKEAMVTERTTSGARIGNWHIRVRTVEGRKLYDVLRDGETAAMASDLSLYEAAEGIARLLHEGVAFNAAEMTTLLRAERVYASQLDDAILFRQRVQQRPADPRRAVFEDRYDNAKHKALAAKREIIRLGRSRL